MRYRIPAGIAAALLSVVVIAGCGGSSGGSSTSSSESSSTSSSGSSTTTGEKGGGSLGSVAFANFTDSGAIFVGLKENLEESAEKLGVEAKTYDNGGDAATTLSNANLMTLEDPDAILEYNPIPEAGDRLGKTFTGAGIPCVAVNTPIEGCAWFNQDDKVLAEDLSGVMASEMEKRKWDGTNTTIVLLSIAEAGEAVNTAVWFDYEQLATKVSGFTEKPASSIESTTTTIAPNAVQVNAGDTEATAYTAMQQALQTIPSSQNIVVMSVSDDATKGAWRAITQAGREKSALISGFGGDLDAVEGLRENPAWVAESSSFFHSWGEYLLALATALTEGVEAPELTPGPGAVITKKNVDTYYTPSGEVKELPPLDPRAKFLEKTGVLQKFGNVQGVH